MTSLSPSLPFSRRDLYGGAITVELPSDFIDASAIRQIPDHQEVYLSPRTLTSLIFEINTYQSQSEIQSQSQTTPELQSLLADTSLSSSTTEKDKENIKASIYHFLDPILPPDKFDVTSQSNVLSPPKVNLSSKSVNAFPVYLSSGIVISAEVDKNASSALPREWAQNPVMTNSEVRVYQLLVRMERYGTDFCVRANVPMKEFVGDKEKEDGELRLVEKIIERIVSTMDVVDFELFGEEEE